MSVTTLDSSKPVSNAFPKPISTPLREVFSLGSWQVDPELNQLIEIANPPHRRTLEPRLMHLLCFLAANADRVLTREVLTDELWPRVIVNDNSLTRAVSELRKQLTLPDRPGAAYLQTIPKRGYRLTCPLQQAVTHEQLPDPEIAQSQATAAYTPSWRRPLQLAACLVLVTLTISFNPPSRQPENQELADNLEFFDQVIETEPQIVGGQLSLSALQEAGAAGQATQFNLSSALSPDGSILAYVRHEGELSTIYLARAGLENDPVAIFSTEDFVYNLGWSPLGNALLFARQSASLLPTRLIDPGQQSDLVMLDLETLSVQVLIDNSPEPRKPSAV